jgi:hypothetical protein
MHRPQFVANENEIKRIQSLPGIHKIWLIGRVSRPVATKEILRDCCCNVIIRKTLENEVAESTDVD